MCWLVFRYSLLMFILLLLSVLNAERRLPSTTPPFWVLKPSLAFSISLSLLLLAPTSPFNSLTYTYTLVHPYYTDSTRFSAFTLSPVSASVPSTRSHTFVSLSYIPYPHSRQLIVRRLSSCLWTYGRGNLHAIHSRVCTHICINIRHTAAVAVAATYICCIYMHTPG